ncbi:class I SAM-dependent methyltransferase [Irregularibacter muris]|uniref:Class I SAM-dependent methyltransferase n=1 Tax=Irregularibacter muris TaxID=1796619 RepID=A0AAE3KZ23_9FIRM|nr:class I SAM-dependent methyltransferase [Irregularibacter muris]MCR1898575.1 class I SAM-dependent methyltransferase [Irregularibacter muris]
MREYYLAYEERYKKVHSEGFTWFSDIPTPELLEWVEFNNIPMDDEICEVGCGEGRDALYLSSEGYKVTAVDASESAILKCKELSKKKGVVVNWKVADALFLNKMIKKQYKWVYSIATLHMLVEDNDRNKFLDSLFNILQPKGKLLLVSMGDGESEKRSDTSTAFELQERSNNVEGKKIMVAGTSYRGVNWEYHKHELERAGFQIEKAINTENHEYGNCMTVYLSRD